MQSDFVEHQLWDPNILGSFKQPKINMRLSFFLLNPSLIRSIHFVFCNAEERGPTAAVFIPRTWSSPPAELSPVLHMTLLMSKYCFQFDLSLFSCRSRLLACAFTILHTDTQPCSPSTLRHFQFMCVLQCKSDGFPFLSLVLLPYALIPQAFLGVHPASCFRWASEVMVALSPAA